jgi:hypothetical protein
MTVSKFADAQGREWRLEFDGFLLDRIATEAKVDLADLSAGGLLAVERDVKALVRVLSVACDEQLKDSGKTAVEFQKQIRKDAITRARGAMMEALADFFPQSEWSAMQSNLTTRKEQPEITPEQILLARDFVKMNPEDRSELLDWLREQAGGGSLESLVEDVSVYGQDATLPTPAAVSPENAESTPEGSLSVTSG